MFESASSLIQTKISFATYDMIHALIILSWHHFSFLQGSYKNNRTETLGQNARLNIMKTIKRSLTNNKKCL